MVPSIGDRTVLIARPTLFASDQYAPASPGARPAPATAVKKIGKTATAIVVCADDAAQSYIAHARNSLRCNPSVRNSRFCESPSGAVLRSVVIELGVVSSDAR